MSNEIKTQVNMTVGASTTLGQLREFTGRLNAEPDATRVRLSHYDPKGDPRETPSFTISAEVTS